MRFWGSFFFMTGSVSMIHRLRTLTGILLVIQVLTLFPHAHDYFGPGSLVSTRTLYGEGEGRLLLMEWLGGSPAAVLTILGVHLVASIAFLAGLYTRIAGVIAFLTLVSIHHQNLVILHAGDSALRNLLFLLIWAPTSSPSKDEPSSPQVPLWTLRMIQIQTSFIYLSTALMKIQGTAWKEGTAVYFATRLWDFERFPIPGILDSLPALRILTWFSLGLEFALGTLIWIPKLRVPLVLLGILFHLGIEWCMNIPWFEWIMIVLLLSFWPSNRNFFPAFLQRSKSAES
jgi:hypothetical protein